MARTRNGKSVETTTKRVGRQAKDKGKETPPADGADTPPVDGAATPPADDAPKKPGDRSRLTMVERVRLAERLIAARSKAKPDSWAVIAKREGIPQRTCQHVLATYQRDMAALGDSTGAPVLSETLMLYTQAIAQLAHEAEYGDNTAARVGAIRQMFEGLHRRVELLAVMGRMPRSFRALDELAMLQRLMRRAAEVVEKHQLPPEVVQELVAIADEIQPVIEGRAHRELPMAS